MRRPLPPLTSTLSALVSATVALGVGAGSATASEPYIRPGDELAVIDTPHLHALVPKAAAEALKPLIARAEVVYVALAKDAGYTITRPLTLLVTDDVDSHNGFSTVTPWPIINVQLAPSLQGSSIFTGHNEFERTLVHELAHHMSNDRDPNPVRRTMSHIFGRILPNDLLSAAFAYLSTPAHQTMPSFWHEGCAQWAETTYAQPGTVWSGRGRDSMSHMVWRLDAAAGAIPPVGDWRLSYHRWPFGSHAYVYGLAYLRYLDAAYGGRASVWQLIERQEHRWPFFFNGGAGPILGKDHITLINEARAALQQEQVESLRMLRQVPVTDSKRLTAVDSTLGAPAWTTDGRLFAALNGPHALPSFVTVDHQGKTRAAGYSAYAMSEARSLSDGTLVFSETSAGANPWARNRVNLVTAKGHCVTLPIRRLLQPDARLVSKAKETDAQARAFPLYQYVAIRLRSDGTHDLVLGEAAVDDGWLSASAQCGPLDHLASEGLPWSPAFRPQHDELTWVETDAKGSRLVWAPIITAHDEPMDGAGKKRIRRNATLGARTVLAEVAGRILHPAWDAKGEHVYFCADHSGVPNAYRLNPTKPGELVPITNTIGGVLACVPSPDGRELAIIDHDQYGPFLARLANDPATWPKSVPKIALAWPAPVPPMGAVVPAGKPDAGAAKDAPVPPRFALPDDQGKPGELKVSPYHGLGELRPLFWTPTTYPVPEGGYGIIGVMADPIFSHELVGSAGVGPAEASPIGFAGYVYSGSPIEIAALGWQSERNFDNQIVDATGQEYDYTETRRNAELRLGRGMAGFRRRFQFYAAGGISEYRPVHAAAKEYNGKPLVNLAPFSDVERYAELTLAYDSSTFFPTSYSREDGPSFAITYRRSGFGGEMHGERATGIGTYVWSFLPEYGQQLVVAGAAGWSNGDRYLQGQYSVGGTFNINALPRGYLTSEAIGYYLTGGSIAWRTPLWRPFHGHSTTPFVTRQVVLETFFDAAHVSTDRLDGNGDWFRSYGAELHVSWVVWELLLNPGIGVAQQLDGDENTQLLIGLDFLW